MGDDVDSYEKGSSEFSMLPVLEPIRIRQNRDFHFRPRPFQNTCLEFPMVQDQLFTVSFRFSHVTLHDFILSGVVAPVTYSSEQGENRTTDGLTSFEQGRSGLDST